MKTYLIGAVCCLFFLGVGFFLGGSRISGEQVSKTVSAEEVSIDEVEVLDESLFEEEKTKESGKEKLSRSEKKARLEKRLKYLIAKAPFSVVKEIFRSREKSLDDAAFGSYEKSDHESKEARIDFENELFSAVLPAIERSYQYKTDGTFEYKGHAIPFQILVSLSNPWPGSKKKKSVPKKVSDFSYLMILSFDTSAVGFGDDRFHSGSGAGIFNVIRKDGRVFLKESIYYREKDTIFNDILYILVESPGREGEHGALRLFDSGTAKWIEVSDRLNWQPITDKEFKEASRARWGRDEI